MTYQVDCIYSGQYIREQTPKDIKECLEQAQASLHSLRSEAQFGRVKSHLFKKIQKDIARFKTILNESLR